MNPAWPADGWEPPPVPPEMAAVARSVEADYPDYEVLPTLGEYPAYYRALKRESPMLSMPVSGDDEQQLRAALDGQRERDRQR